MDLRGLQAGLAVAFGRIRRWLRLPRILRPTRPGWLFLAIILGVGFAALNTGNNLLYLVLSLMLAFLALSGVLSESALRGIEVRRRLPREIFAEAENSMLIEVRNSQRRIAAYAVVIEDRLEAASDGRVQLCRPPDESRRRRRRGWRRRRERTETAGRCFFLRIGPGESETRRYALSPTRRGPLHFASVRVSTRFPFGLFLKYRELDLRDATLVYPPIVDHRVPARTADAESTGDAPILRPGAGGVVSSLREFTGGDSVRRVHWRSSLRRGSLLVTETEDEREAEIEVRLRARHTPDRGTDRASGFERAVSRAASEVVQHLQAGLAVALRTEAVYLPAETGDRQRARLLSFLARVAPDGRAPVGDAG